MKRLLKLKKLYNLTEENIRTYFDEHEWININRQKTGAESVNMATLEYESWQVADRKLTLRGRSIGNGGTFPFEEVWNVVMVSKKKLVLQRGGVYKTYWAPVREE